PADATMPDSLHADNACIIAVFAISQQHHSFVRRGGAVTATREITAATLIGRTAELEQMRHLLDGAARGESQLLLLSGEPGIGKTRLLQALSTEAHGFRVFGGRGTELEHETPFAPLIEALDGAISALDESRLDGLREELPDLVGVLPSVGRP